MSVPRMFFLALAISIAGQLSAQDLPSKRTISTEGESVVKVVPDEVCMAFEVTNLHQDLLEGRKGHAQQVQAVIEKAKGAGVESKDIQTDFIRIEPEYENRSMASGASSRVFQGYRFRTDIVVLLRDISKFETLVTAGLTSGAKELHGIEFRTSQLRKHRDAARAAALRAAREKAIAMGGEFGQKVGRPRTIQEGRGTWFDAYGSRSQSPYQNSYVVDGAPGSGDEGGLAPGMITIRATVSVTFDLE